MDEARVSGLGLGFGRQQWGVYQASTFEWNSIYRV